MSAKHFARVLSQSSKDQIQRRLSAVATAVPMTKSLSSNSGASSRDHSLLSTLKREVENLVLQVKSNVSSLPEAVGMVIVTMTSSWEAPRRGPPNSDDSGSPALHADGRCGREAPCDHATTCSRMASDSDKVITGCCKAESGRCRRRPMGV